MIFREPSSKPGYPLSSKMVPRLSSVAAWMNEQVLTMTASAASGSSHSSYPADATRFTISAESTSFFAQPSVMNAIRREPAPFPDAGSPIDVISMLVMVERFL